MPKNDKKDKGPLYLVTTPLEDLIDDGLVFDGDNGKDQIINQFDFMSLREIIQRNGQAPFTPDQATTLLRYLRLCIKEGA
jgi:hypothetical protein